MTEDEAEFDVVVVGSGAAGMTAALTAAHSGLTAVVVEKENVFGGSTARSGGGLWLPGNEVLRRAGVADTAERAQAYLAHVVGPEVPPARQRALIEHGPAMLAFVRAHTPLAFSWVPGYADYYPEAPGGLPGGRTIEPVPLDGRLLGPDLATLAPPYVPVPDGVVVTARDYKWLSLGTRHRRALLTGARVFTRAVVNRALGRRMLGLGQALAAGLRAGLRDAGVPVRLGTPMTDLVVDGERVTGVRVNGGHVVRARRGVVLGSGGFEHNEAMRKLHQRAPIGTDWTVGASGNTGDGIEAGRRLGAALDLMDDAWWGPAIPLPHGPYFCLAERSLPGSLIVNTAGQRFVNEAAPYVDAVHAMYDTGSIPAWLIADQTYRDRYLFAGRGPRAPLPRRWYASGAVQRAVTLDELAVRIGVDGAALQATVERFNDFAAAGRDEDFGRGDSAYDRYYGDPRNRPNPCLAPLRKPPFHAFRMVPGDLGTKGGLRTDDRARVLRDDGTRIAGLYAAGNASASVMGHSYAGAGATIGPAMTFAYLAALDAATPED
ncbi:3-oxosteroid 1-dehydrogenase [Phytohabitans rumicis]|uniref:3-oxosteroid 1-dehydrogenase n=1 Tax=Phytohabitans rumicis TaxID=1076125 RepID=A0A6V8LN41_9ACTN|nr:3-oxosteroid 1-dehydrogenase [Phytohabitans rumicis]GFJ96431.1 3-ketosteroid-delta-1-dehydrogenase [Phytohabitans rumicis]